MLIPQELQLSLYKPLTKLKGKATYINKGVKEAVQTSTSSSDFLKSSYFSKFSCIHYLKFSQKPKPELFHTAWIQI